MLRAGLILGLAGVSVWGQIVVDAPLEGAVYPAEMTAPQIVWRDATGATVWKVEAAGVRVWTRGARLRVGAVDAECVAETNRAPELTAEERAARAWRPAAAEWARMKRAGRVRVSIEGYRGGARVSRGEVGIEISRDAVGARIFYRDVPLMPTQTESGVIQPLAQGALRLVKWRLRDLGETESRVVMERLPVCANCHSFSAGGEYLGMDLDGLQGNKGQYFRAKIAGETLVGDGDLVEWRSEAARLRNKVRVGFMSQISPDGRFVATTVNPAMTGSGEGDPPSNYYVMNFADYRFLQVFFPTRGLLGWADLRDGVVRPLPGADDPQYVQFGGVWSRDGKWVVFARAGAGDPGPAVARFANDPRERQIQYDLYRVAFNEGRGGVAERVVGASENGMSNTFPKVSPDGRWIVFVKARNGQLMRPDSELWIVPFEGGKARRMNCNTKLMNSWHSFSPNGRWMVFSSKARGPYTQMYLTHIDEHGVDSPAVLIENSTAANRAVNLPEFVAVKEWRSLGGPALEYYRLFDRAAYLQKAGRFGEAVEAWRLVLGAKPEDDLSMNEMGVALLRTGRVAEARATMQRAAELRARRLGR